MQVIFFCFVFSTSRIIRYSAVDCTIISTSLIEIKKKSENIYDIYRI